MFIINRIVAMSTTKLVLMWLLCTLFYNNSSQNLLGNSVEVPHCPEDFTDEGTFCYKLSEKSSFPPKCPFNNQLSFGVYEPIITEPVWMPVTRDRTNGGLGFFKWTELTFLYKTYFNRNYIFSGSIKDNDCLVYFNTSYILAVPCSDTYPGICAYLKLDEMPNSLCPQGCRQSDYTPKSPCFCPHKSLISTNIPKAEFLKKYQNSLYPLLTNETCTIGLERSANGTFVWSSSQEETTYTFWSPDVSFDPENIYGAATPTGWILTQQPLPCFLSEDEVDIGEPSIELTKNLDSLSINLQIYNVNGLQSFDGSVESRVYCFTDATISEGVFRYPNFNIPQSVDYNYSMPISVDGPGNHWCEAVTYDSRLINASYSFFFGNEFVVLAVIHYNESTNPVSNNIVSLVVDHLCPSLGHHEDMYKYTCRFMKVVDLDEGTRRVWVNFHLSTQNEFDYEGQYHSVKNIVVETFSQNTEVVADLVDFLASFYCFGEVKNNLTWPNTTGQIFAHSKEFCFNSNGDLVSRYCDGNFVDGLKWLDVEDCEIATESTKTLLLTQFQDNLAEITIDLLDDLWNDHKDFNALDIYLTAIILTDEVNSCESYKTHLPLNIINSVMNFDKEVLHESQMKMKGASLLLDLVVNILSTKTYISENNGNFLMAQYRDVCGIVVQRQKNEFTDTSLKCESSKARIQDYDECDIAILLSIGEETHTGIDLITFAVFLQDVLFIEKEPSLKVVSSVFAVTLPELSADVKDAIKITIVEQIDTDEEKFCSIWRKDHWEVVSKIDNSFVFCEYYGNETTFFAITSKLDPPKNETRNDVTDDLLSVIESNDTVSNTVERVANISTRHDEFKSLDVYLLGKILEKISTSQEVSLKKLAHIVSNVQKIERSVLSQSQQERSATDLILSYVDVILKNHDYQQPVKEIQDNFMVIIHKAKDGFSGLSMSYHNETLRPEILEGDLVIDDISNADCGVLLTPELKNQLNDDSQVVITFFFKDVLFQDKSTESRIVTTIFGVILPEIENYQSPVSIFHKVPRPKKRKKCVHWYYNYFSDVSGFWKQDSGGKDDVNSLVQCDFWHTTHLALLLLDEDKYETKNDALGKITIITATISLISLCGVVLTAVLFKSWRHNTSNQILLNFVIANILLLTFYIYEAIRQDVEDPLLCIFIGSILHYCIIAEFSWMLVIAVLQHRRFVSDVFGTNRENIFWKCFLAGWLPPVVPVISVLIFDRKSFLQGPTGLCYPSGLSLHLGVWFPVITIIFINFVIYVRIMCHVSCKNRELVYGSNNSDWKYQLMLGVLLFSMLGLTWTFGFLAELSFGVVFAYMFNLTATLQGYIIFLFFIVFNAKTRKLYVHAMKNCYYRKCK